MVIAVLGAGSIGRRHAANLATLGRRVELLGWRDADLPALGRRRDITALVIATATPVRLDPLRLAAERDWPVYCEKPLAWRPEQVAALFAAAAPVAARSVIGFMMRYHPAMVALAAADLSATYGFSFEIGHDVRQWRANWRFADSYAAQPEGGGVLLDLCHEIDMAAALFPGLAVTDVQSLGHPRFPGVDFASRVTLASGHVTGSVAMDYLSPVSLRRLGLRGLDAIRDLDFLGPRLTTMGPQAGPDARQVQDFAFDRNDMFLALMRDWLTLVDGGTPDNPRLPRFDRMRETCDLIATAWTARRFAGHVAPDMD